MALVVVLLGLVAVAAAQTDDCTDKHELCSFWATEFDQCNQNAIWMKPNCPASCGPCQGERKVLIKECNDKDPQCEAFEKQGECEKNPQYMFWKCTKACKFCKKAGPHPYPTALERHAKKNEGGGEEHERCIDKNDLCPFWGSIGECTANPTYMLVNCKASCTACTAKKIKVEKCDNEDDHCEAWKAAGECTKPSPFYMFWKCEKTCGFCTKDGETIEYPQALLSTVQSTPAPLQNAVPQVPTGTSPQPPTSQPPNTQSSPAPTALPTVPQTTGTQTTPLVLQVNNQQPSSAAVPQSSTVVPAGTQPPVAVQATSPVVITQTSSPVPLTTPVVTQGSSTAAAAPAVTQGFSTAAAAPAVTQGSSTAAAAPAVTQGSSTAAAAPVQTTTAGAPAPPVPTQSSTPAVQAAQTTAGATGPTGGATGSTVGSSVQPSVAQTTVGFVSDQHTFWAETCVDKHALCAFWQSIGECNANPRWMLPNCGASCTQCTAKKIQRQTCEDEDPNCAAFGQQGECSKSSIFYMFWKCPQTCNWCTATIGTETDYPAGILQAAVGPAGTSAPQLIRHHS